MLITNYVNGHKFSYKQSSFNTVYSEKKSTETFRPNTKLGSVSYTCTYNTYVDKKYSINVTKTSKINICSTKLYNF